MTTFIDAMPMLCVIGAVTLALGVDLAAAIAWLRRDGDDGIA